MVILKRIIEMAPVVGRFVERRLREESHLRFDEFEYESMRSWVIYDFNNDGTDDLAVVLLDTMKELRMIKIFSSSGDSSFAEITDLIQSERSTACFVYSLRRDEIPDNSMDFYFSKIIDGWMPYRPIKERSRYCFSAWTCCSGGFLFFFDGKEYIRLYLPEI